MMKAGSLGSDEKNMLGTTNSKSQPSDNHIIQGVIMNAFNASTGEEENLKNSV